MCTNILYAEILCKHKTMKEKFNFIYMYTSVKCTKR